MSKYATVNPATAEQIQTYTTASDDHIQACLDAVTSGYQTWHRTPIEERAATIGRAAALIRERKYQLADLITLEMGKLPSEAAAEIDLTADILSYYANDGPGILADETLHPASGGRATVRSDSLGPLVGVMPWNFPFYQIARFAGPNLVAGNTMLLKHAPNCPQCALAFEDIVNEAGVAEGAYINIFATNEQIQHIIADDRIRGVSLTGSERAGSAVAQAAGKHVKKVVLELGGSDPYIVLDDADLDATVAEAVRGRVTNAGQSCIASKRLIILEQFYDAFVAKFTQQMAALTPGDPHEEQTTLSPLSSESAAVSLMEQVHDAIDKGATVTTGGGRVNHPGAFVEPTVLTDVTRNMRAFAEELFGPVAVVYRVSNEQEAIDLANESSYGLGGTVVSSDIRHAEHVADQVNTGMVWINHATWTEPDLPFGGTKHSGIGHELGEPGIQQFLNKKLIRVME